MANKKDVTVINRARTVRALLHDELIYRNCGRLLIGLHNTPVEELERKPMQAIRQGFIDKLLEQYPKHSKVIDGVSEYIEWLLEDSCKWLDLEVEGEK